MSMIDILARIIPWYDPAGQAQRERRTGEARNRAITARIRAEGVVDRVVAVQMSYQRADERIRKARSRE
jgi:hypothetical protein